jgi:Anti-sigma-K factor rskA
VTQVAPPPRLRGELLAIVRSEARKETKPERRRSWWPSWLAMPRPAVAALGAAAVIAAGIIGYSLRGDSESSTFQANPSPAAPRAEAELVVEDGSGTLHATGLPRLQRDEVFQAWIQDRGEAELQPSTLFKPVRGGAATATIAGLEDAEAVLVSREPRGSFSPARGGRLSGGL